MMTGESRFKPGDSTPSSPPSRARASRISSHRRSSSILSSSSVLSIPSRSSSVALNIGASIPLRSSSIASPTKPGLPTTPSDLADTIAELKLSDDANGKKNTDAVASRAARPDPSRSAEASGRTTLTPSSSFTAAGRDSPRQAAAGTSNGPTFGNDREERSMSETAEEIEDASQAIEDVRRHIFVIQEKRHSGKFSGNGLAGQADPSSSRTDPLSGALSSTPASQKLGPNDKDAGPSRRVEDLPTSELEMALMQLDEKLEGVSRSMQQLEVRIGEICAHLEDPDPDSSIVDKEMLTWRSRQRRESMGSMGSLSSFDEMMLPSFAPTLSPKALKTRYDDLLSDWTKVQQESEALKKELNDDKYIVVFRSVSEQARSMMDSLDKAIAHCQTFVSDFNRDYQAGLISTATSEATDADEFTGSERDPSARLAELIELKKAFTVKKSYYTPACDQVFQVLDRGTKERGASNGTIIRNLADLKLRWKQMRERVHRTEKNMKRIEALLQRLQAGVDDGDADAAAGVAFPIASSPSMPNLSLTNPGVGQLQQAALGQGSPGRPMLTPKSALRSANLGARVASGPGRLSNSSSVGSNLSNTPPVPPPKSRLRRISATAESLGLQSQPASTPPRAAPKLPETPRSLRPQRSQNFATAISNAAIDGTARHNRSNSAAFPEILAMKSWNRAKLGGSPPDTRRPLPSIGRPSALSNRGQGDAGLVESVGTTSRAPPSSFRPTWLGSEANGGSSGLGRPKTPQPQPSWSIASAQDASAPRLPAPTSRPASRQGMSAHASRANDAGVPDTEGVEWMSAPSDDNRPGSSMGAYYRPPSAQGTRGDAKARRRESMIPRLALSTDGTEASSPARPGSSLSQASNSAYMNSANRAALTPPRYNAAASRATMQTPEPTIMARAQRLSMYARAPSTGIAGAATPGTPASKRNSKPPPTRLNPALMSSSSRSASGGGGRTTPLSAAALASLPKAEPDSSIKRSSVANFRATRGYGTSVVGGGGGGGRTTPTLSDAGSIGGLSNATWTGGMARLGSGSMAGSTFGVEVGRGARIEMYRPNPNDALDVEVAAIANGLGVSLDRIDPPLPRGVKLAEGPGKDNRARYEVGGKDVVCRLLELHRPAGSAGARAGTKAKKILVRVGGGWQDLEQWLLNRLSQQ